MAQEKSPLDDIDPDLIDFNEEDETHVVAAEGETPAADGEQPRLKSDTELEGEIKGLTAADFSEDPEVGQKIQDVFLKSSRGKRMLAAFKRDRELGAPLAEDGTGGLGYVPSVDEIKDMHQRSLAHERFVSDLDSLRENPERAPEILGFLLGTQDAPVETADLLVQQLPRHLAQHNPQALQRLEGMVLNATAARLEQLAQQTADPGEKRYREQMANGLRYLLNPKAATPARPNGAAQQPPSIEQTEEYKRFQAEREAFHRNQTQAQQEQYRNFQAVFYNEAASAVEKMVLQPFAKRVDLNEIFGEEIIGPYLRTQVEGVLDSVLSNPDIDERVSRRLRAAFTNGSTQEKERALQDVRKFAEPFIRQTIGRMRDHIKARLPKPSQGAQADVTRQAYEQQQAGRTPEQGGAPAGHAPGVNGIADWQPGKESPSDFFKRSLDSIGAPV